MSIVDEDDPRYAPFRQMLGGGAGAPPGMPGAPAGMPPGMPPGMPGGAGMPGDPAELEKMLKNLSPAELDELMRQCSAGLDQKVRDGFSMESQLDKPDAEGGVTVQPKPGFVIKTDDLESGQKVFINATSSEWVEKPHEKSIPDSPEEMGIRVPLSVGTGEEDFDKKHQPCVTYDVVLNPHAITASEEDPNFRHMVVQLLMGSVAQKYSLQLNPKYRLPKMAYKGGEKTRIQRLKVKKESQIEEVESKPRDIDEGSAPAYAFSITYEAEGEEPIDGLTLPSYSEEVELQANLKTRVFGQETEETGLGKLLANRICVITVSMPEVKTAAAIELDLSDECARVATSGLRSNTLMLWFPIEFCSRLATADWNPVERQLVLRVPCSPFVGFEEPAEDPSVFANSLADITF